MTDAIETPRLVTLGDGRVVECAKGITKLPPGPMPEVLFSEAAWVVTLEEQLGRDTDD